MVKVRFVNSVVTRLMVSLVFGGLVISAGLTVLELRRSEALLQLEVTQQIALTTRNLQSVLHGLIDRRTQKEIKEAIRVFIRDERIRAARVSGQSMDAIVIGDWVPIKQRPTHVWPLPERAISTGNEVHMDELTLVQAAFVHDGRPLMLELVVDGPAARGQLQARVFKMLVRQWLLVGVMTLMGLMLLRRWFTGPLSQVMDRVGVNAGAESFYALARQMRSGEFAQLPEAIGGMLTRLKCTTEQLHRRERAFENLYQFAPAAMISLDATGKVVEANLRAAQLIGLPTEKDLLKRDALDMIQPEDRPLLRQTIDRLVLDNAARCELRLIAREQSIDVVVEATGVRDKDGALSTVRLALQDVSQIKKLQRQLADQTQLMNLVIDHMSDAIVLIGPDGRIAAHNQKLTALLNYPSSGRHDALVDRTYDVESFWDELRVEDHDSFVGRLRLAEAQPHPVQEKVRAGAGVFLFQVVPVHEGGDGAASMDAIGRLWVVREITAIEQNQRLLEQQSMQIQSLRRLGEQLNEVGDTYELLERTVRVIRQVGSVDAVGLALRCDHDDRRSHQVIDLGGSSSLVETGQHIVEAVERHLMPEVLMNDQTAFWPDLPEPAPWSTTFDHAGLTTLAAAPLRGRDDAHGVIWIAKRGGDRLDRHHIHLLEAVRPIITAHIDAALLRTQLRTLRLTDHVTQLPNHQMFDHMMEGMLQRPGHRWAIMLIKLDHFGQLNERLDHDQADGVLRSIGAIIKANCRTSTFLARLHSATFAIILTPDSPATHVALAHRLQQLVADQQIELSDGESWHFTASVGIACCPDDTTAQNLFDLAASRLEAARRTGRNRVVSDGPDPERFVG